MKKFILITALFILITDLQADLGLSTIQAVCKITLKNGESYEGFVTLAEGGYLNYYLSNGFCIIDKTEKYREILFDLDIEKLHNAINHNINSKDKKTLFLLNITRQGNHKKEQEIYLRGENQVLETRITNIQNYILQDTLLIYKTLPHFLLLNRGEFTNEEIIKISVSDILTFEFMTNPSEKWLNEIEIKTKQLFSEEVSADYVAPLWLHEIVKNEEKLAHLQKYFLINLWWDESKVIKTN